MLLRLSYILIFIFFLGCNNSEPNKKTNDADSASSPKAIEKSFEAASISGCYLRALNRDTLAAFLEQSGNRITGKLTFDNYQKDGSSGTVEGRIENDIVRLVYRFQSEGMSSVSEIFFKKAGNNLVHGFGEVKVMGDSAYFTDPAKITYTDSLIKIECAALAGKYK